MIQNELNLIKTHEPDKDKFIELLLAAKGGRTMKDFAELCGANPSTFTRITQKLNKGGSTPELLKAIAKNAEPQSGVTLEALAHANGYSIEKKTHNSRPTLYAHLEMTAQSTLINELVSRGNECRMGYSGYRVSKSIEITPDLFITTNAFGKANENWLVEILCFEHYSWPQVREIKTNRRSIINMAFGRLSSMNFLYMSKSGKNKPMRYSLVVFDKESFDIICDEFSATAVPMTCTVILIDTDGNRIADEFILPHIENGSQESYFMTTPRKYGKNDNGIYEDDYFEERREEDDLF